MRHFLISNLPNRNLSLPKESLESKSSWSKFYLKILFPIIRIPQELRRNVYKGRIENQIICKTHMSSNATNTPVKRHKESNQNRSDFKLVSYMIYK